MYELMYHSLATPDLSAKDIRSILETARSFNAEHGITGCLFYHNQEFVQLLEGEQATIKELFSHIELDTRHSNVVILAEGEKQKRTFDTWSMAYHEFNNETIERLLFIDNFLAFSKLADKPTHAVRLFHYMAEELLSE